MLLANRWGRWGIGSGKSGIGEGPVSPRTERGSARRCEAGMDRAIPIAATCSVALHLAALTLSQHLFDGSASPSIASRVLAIDLEVPLADQSREGEAPVDEGTRS